MTSSWYIVLTKVAKTVCQEQVFFYKHIWTHRGRVTHISVDNLTIIGSDNGLSPRRRQAIIWTNAGIFLTGPWGTNFSDILIGIQTFSFKKMHLKMSSAKWRPICLGLNVLTADGCGVISESSISSESHVKICCHRLSTRPLRTCI